MNKTVRRLVMFALICICFCIITTSFIMKQAVLEIQNTVNQIIEHNIRISGKYETAWTTSASAKNLSDNNEMFRIQQDLQKTYDVQNCLMKILYTVTFDNGIMADSESVFINALIESFVDDTAVDFMNNEENADGIRRYLNNSYIRIIGDNKPDLLYHRYNEELFYYVDKKNNIDFEYFTEDEMSDAAFVCYVPYNSFYYSSSESGIEYKDLLCGDEIILADFYVNNQRLAYVKTYRLKVKGLYYTTDTSSIGDAIFIPQNTLLSIQEEEQKLMKQYDYSIIDDIDLNDLERASALSKPIYALEAVISTQNSEQTEEVNNVVKAKCSGLDDIHIISSEQNYTHINSIILEMIQKNNTIFFLAISLSVILIALITLLLKRIQRKEDGLLLALGKPKSAILKSQLCELFIITSTAIAFSLVLGFHIAKSVCVKVFGNYRIPKEIYRSASTVAIEKAVRQFNISLSMNDILHITIICSGAVLISYVITFTEISRRNPKALLREEI